MRLTFGVPVRSGLVAWLILFCATAAAANGAPVPTSRIDVFIGDTDRLHELNRVSRAHPGIEIRVFVVTGIQRLEALLSKGLSADPGAAKRQALERLGALDDAARDSLKHSAIGLAEAVRLGVTQYPAIVFDGQHVIYGMTDLGRALEHFGRWQGEPR